MAVSFAAKRRRANGFVWINGKKNVDYGFVVIFDCSITKSTLNNVYAWPNSRCVSKSQGKRVLEKGGMTKSDKNYLIAISYLITIFQKQNIAVLLNNETAFAIKFLGSFHQTRLFRPITSRLNSWWFYRR